MRHALAIGLVSALALSCAKVENVDQPVPPFEVMNLEGAPVSSVGILGKPTLINFWSPQ